MPRRSTSAKRKGVHGLPMLEYVSFFKDPVNVSVLKNRFRPPIQLAADLTAIDTNHGHKKKSRKRSTSYLGLTRWRGPSSDNTKQRMFIASLYLKDCIQRIISVREDLSKVSITIKNHDILALVTQLGRIGGELEGVTAKALLGLYMRIIDYRKGLEILLESDPSENFRSTHFSDVAEELLRMDEKIQAPIAERRSSARAGLRNNTQKGKKRQSTLNPSKSSPRHQQIRTRHISLSEQRANFSRIPPTTGPSSAAPSLRTSRAPARLMIDRARSSALLSPPPSSTSTGSPSQGSQSRNSSGTDTDQSSLNYKPTEVALGKRKRGYDNNQLENIGSMAEASMQEMRDQIEDLVNQQQRQRELVDKQQQEIAKLLKTVEALREVNFEQDMSVDNRLNEVEANALKTTFRLNAVDKWIMYIRNKLSD